MKKYPVTIIVSLLIGFLLSYYLTKEYESVDIVPVFNRTEMVYLLQQGVYSSKESMEKNTHNLTDYIYNIKDNMYYVYIAISLNENNINKIKKYYDDKEIKTIIKTTTINNNDFLTKLENYDLVINQTEDKETINEIIKETMQEYKKEE